MLAADKIGCEFQIADGANTMVEFHLTGQALWDRMNRAVEKVQERLEKQQARLSPLVSRTQSSVATLCEYGWHKPMKRLFARHVMWTFC